MSDRTIDVNGHETFFETIKPPEHFGQALSNIDEFLARHMSTGKDVVVVTSGGSVTGTSRAQNDQILGQFQRWNSWSHKCRVTHRLAGSHLSL